MCSSDLIEKMEHIQAELRRFRHDFKNMMAGMYLQAREGDLDAVQSFIQEMTEDFDRQVGEQVRLMNQLANVHMAEIKGLLLEKLAWIICRDFLSATLVTEQVLITYTSAFSEKGTISYPFSSNICCMASVS